MIKLGATGSKRERAEKKEGLGHKLHVPDPRKGPEKSGGKID